MLSRASADPVPPGPGPTALAALLAALLAGGIHALWGDVGFRIADESFLWYGVQRTVAGEIPLRDFQSYEPGRYYWAAAWARGLGSGLLALRLSSAIFQAIGLWFGLLVARRVVPHPGWLVPIGLVLALWMFPRHKLFEPALAMMAVYAALRLLEAPSLRGHFGAGLFVGLATCFGRNHGLYAGLAIASLVLWLHWKLRRGTLVRKLAATAAGGLVGSAPLLGMLLFVPGFAASFFESLLFYVEQGANLPKPVPWPWRGRYEQLSWFAAAARLALGLCFVLLPLLYAFGVVLALRTRRERLAGRAALFAATAVGIFYAHHAAVRSDAGHLAQSIPPLLLAGFALPRALGWLERRVLTGCVWGGLALLTAAAVPVYGDTVMPRWKTQGYVRHRLGEDEVWLPAQRARALGRIQFAVGRRVRGERSLFVAPVPLYPLLDLRAPVRDLFFAWEAKADRQRALIEDLDAAAVSWVLLLDFAIRAKEEFRFQNTHPLVWRYLEREFEPTAQSLLPPGASLFERRASGPGRSGAASVSARPAAAVGR